MTRPIRSRFLISLLRWVDSEAGLDAMPPDSGKRAEWLRITSFVILHAMCFGVIWVGWSWTAVATALVLYFVRMFAITGFYHRYFSHKAYQTNCFWQFIFAVLGNSAVQRGPLWWASHHRFADTDEEPHSPLRHGFWWSHIGWLTSARHFSTRTQYVKEWLRYPELVWLNRFDTLVPFLLALKLYALGYMLDHMLGSRRYPTPDTSRNNALLALITLGEGWHNNHHHYAISARQGFFWWEFDITYYLLKLMS